MSKAFPISGISDIANTLLPKDIVEVSDSFGFAFQPAGYMTQSHIYTTSVAVAGDDPILLGSLLEKCKEEDYYLTSDRLQKWDYLKGAKKIPRTAANGHQYVFSEGPVAFPDPWDRPARTMLTSESTLNRSSHVVAIPVRGGSASCYRKKPKNPRLPVGWTGCITSNSKPMPRRMRYFCMGNALVVPMITRMGKVLDTIIEKES